MYGNSTYMQYVDLCVYVFSYLFTQYYIYMYMYLYLCVCVNVYVYVSLSLSLFVHVLACSHGSMFAWLQAGTHAWMVVPSFSPSVLPSVYMFA